MTRRVVLLDRDGVLNADRVDFVLSVEQLRILPGVPEALARLRSRGFELAIVTNQSAVGRGLLPPAQLSAIHDELRRALADAGVALAGIFVCPHAPADGCDCRKPKPGLLFAARDALGIDLAQTWFVGDALRDVEAAMAAGARPALVRTGKGASVVPPAGVEVFADLDAFARFVGGEAGARFPSGMEGA